VCSALSTERALHDNEPKVRVVMNTYIQYSTVLTETISECLVVDEIAHG